MKYDIIIVLCPDKKGDNGKFPEFKNGKYLGGQTRMDAAVEISKESNKTKFILVGGYNEDDGVISSTYYMASQKTTDMQDFMKEKGARNEIKIVNSLPCTRHNLIAIFNERMEELSNTDFNIGLLTNFYHLPRALNLWTKLAKEEKEFEKKIIENPTPIVAESIVEENKRYSKHHEYILRLENELKGLIDLDTYKYKKENQKYERQYMDKCLRKEFSRIIEKEKKRLLTKEEKENRKLLDEIKKECDSWLS